jgi:hypothetical protein
VAIRGYLNKKKANTIIEAQKTEVENKNTLLTKRIKILLTALITRAAFSMLF